MFKLISLILVVAFAAVGLADTELPLPGPGAPPTEPPRAQPTPPPYEPYPTPAPYPPAPPQGPETTYTVGGGQVGRFKESTFTYSIPANLNNIRALRITCTNEKIKIKKVTIQFTNGQVSELSLLTGTFRLGDFRLSYLYGAPIYRITVVAASSSIFRKNGAFRLDATSAIR